MSHTLLTPVSVTSTCVKCGEHREGGLSYDCVWGCCVNHFLCPTCAEVELKTTGGSYDCTEVYIDQTFRPDFDAESNQEDFEETIMPFADRNSRISQRIC